MLFPFFGPLSNKLWVKVRYPINIYIYIHIHIYIYILNITHHRICLNLFWLNLRFCWLRFLESSLCLIMHSCVGYSISPFLLTISWLSLVLTPVLLLVPPCFFLQSPTHVNCLVRALLLGISCDIHCWCWLESTSALALACSCLASHFWLVKPLIFHHISPSLKGTSSLNYLCQSIRG